MVHDYGNLIQVPLPGLPFRILVTGWRDWPSNGAYFVFRELDRVAEIAQDSGRIIVTEGQCPYGGVDDYAFAWATVHEPWTVPDRHPADWLNLGKAAGPVRNAEMVALKPDICLAFPGPNSSGTVDCIRQAKAAGIPVQIFPWEDFAQELDDTPMSPGYWEEGGTGR